MELSSLWRRTPRSMLGVDIGSWGIHVVQIQDQSKRPEVMCFGSEPLPSGAVIGGQIEDPQVVASALKRLLDRVKVQTKQQRAAFVLPSSLVDSKRVFMPGGLSEAALEIQVEGEAQRFLHDDLSDVNLDYTLTQPAERADEEDEYLVMAVRKDIAAQFEAVADQLDLQPSVLDVYPFANERAIYAQRHALDLLDQEKVVVVFDMGDMRTRVTAYGGAEVLYEDVHDFGGEQLTRRIEAHFGLSAQDAIRHKHDGSLPPAYAREVLQPFIDLAAQEIKIALDSFLQQSMSGRVDATLLAGGGALVPNLAYAVSVATGSPCHLVNPFLGMDLGSKVIKTKLQFDAPAYMTACGLAMRKLGAS